MITIEEVHKLGTEIETELRKSDSLLLDKYPINRFVQSSSYNNHRSNYKQFSNLALEIHYNVKNDFSHSAAINYHRLFLLKYIEQSLNELNLGNFPPTVVQNFENHFERIYKRINTNNVTTDWIDFTQDKFCKEFSIIRLQAIPVGPQFITINQLSLSMVKNQGILLFIKSMVSTLFLVRGYKPIYELHTNQIDPFLMSHFNPNGWKTLFNNLAELVEKNKSIKCILGSAWFFDPALKEVSPEIAYIREYALEAGGFFMKLKTDDYVIKDATFMNRNRKKMFEEGKYIPTPYRVIIPRGSILKWKHQQKLV